MLEIDLDRFSDVLTYLTRVGNNVYVKVLQNSNFH